MRFSLPFALRASRVTALCLLALAVFAVGPLLAADESPRCDLQPYVENEYWTTEYGPAAADIHTGSENFVKCSQGQYALCYYSGAPAMPCRIDEVTGTASCSCQVFTASKEQPQMVTIGAIQNTCVYIETVAKCGVDGSGCPGLDEAPVCKYLADGTFNPTTDLVSTFSFQKVTSPESDGGDDDAYKLGCTECEGVYAGCMTAPCYQQSTSPNGNSYAWCECPLARGPYQYGRGGDQWSCDAGDGLTWSAAFTPAGCPSTPGIGSMAAPTSDR